MDGQKPDGAGNERHLHSHNDCAYCAGDADALARQERLENSALFRMAEAGLEKADNALNKLAYGDGKHVKAEFTRLTRPVADGRHQEPPQPSRLYQVGSRQVAAGALAFMSAAAPSATALDALSQPIPVVSETSGIDTTRAELFSPEAVISPRMVSMTDDRPDVSVVPTTTQPEASSVEVDDKIEQPLVRTLFPGQTIRDFIDTMAGDLSRPQRVELIKQTAELSGVDLESGEDRQLKVGFELKLPIDTAGLELYTVKKGDTSAQLYAELGWQEKGYSFDQFLKANAIVNKDEIRTGWQIFTPAVLEPLEVAAEPNQPTQPPVNHPNNSQQPLLPKQPETVTLQQPKQPQLIEGPPDNDRVAVITRQLQAELPEIGQVNVDEDQIALDNGRYMNRKEAISALNLLIAAARDYENPLHDLPVPPIEHLPTPEADGLRTRQESILNDLINGDTNLAYLQSELLQRLAAQPDGRVDGEKMKGAANRFVRFVAERNDWVISDEEADVMAGLMVRGAMPLDLSSASHAQLEAASTADRLNQSALTIDLYQASLQGHMDEQIELVRLAEQQLELLRSNMRDLSEEEITAIAQNVIMAKRGGQPVNDYSYEVFKAKLGEQTNQATVLKLLGRQLYASRNSDDLLELLPSAEAKLAETVEGWLAAEGTKSLSGLLETLSSQLDQQIASITERGGQLQELELDLEELNPALTDLSSAQIYELAKTILSAEENEQRVGDDWYYLIELKAPAGEDLDQTLLNLAAGIYKIQGADLLLAGSDQEQTAVVEAIDQYLAGPERNIKAFLDAQFAALEQRLTSAEAEVAAIIEAVKGVLPELNFDESELSAMPVRRLLGQTDQALVDQITGSFENMAGRPLTLEETARIGVEMIKLQNPDQNARLDELGKYLLDFYNQNNANYYLEGAGDPAILTLSRMLEEGKYVINYEGGDVSIFSEAFMNKLRAYNTIPSSLFPGTQWLIKGYAGQDLRPYFEHLGLDADAILASPYNDQLKLTDGRITADANGAIWFDAGLWEGSNAPDFEAAADWVYGEIPGIKYTVSKGQTYTEIARMFRVDGEVPNWKEILEWNRGRLPSDPTKLRAGTEIVIPQHWMVHEDGLDDRPDIEAAPSVVNRGIQDTRNAIADNARTQLERDVVEDAGRNRDSRGIIVHYCNGQDRQWEWCACFASTMLKDSGIDVEGRYGHVEPGALRLMELLKDDPRFEFISPDKINDNTDLMTGDLVFYTRGGGKGHVGVVDRVKDAGLAVTIDGNMGDKLAERRLDVAGHERFVGVIRYVGESQSEPIPEVPAEQPPAEPAPTATPEPAPEAPAPEPESNIPEWAPDSYKQHVILNNLSDNFWDIRQDMPSLEEAVESYNSRDGDDWGPRLSQADRLYLAYAAGARGEDLVFLGAVSNPESGGAAYVIGDHNIHDEGDMSPGPWQIYTAPTRGWDSGTRDAEDNLDPLHNAQSAVSILNSQGRDAWSSKEKAMGYMDEVRALAIELGLYDQ